MSINLLESIYQLVPSELLDSPLCLSHLDEIALHLNTWEDLAPYIGISNKEQREISECYSGSYRIQKKKALRTWKKNLGDKATLKSFIKILCGEALVEVAERLKEVIRRRPTSLQIFAKYLCEYYKFDPNAVGEKTLHRFHDTRNYVDLVLHEVSTEERMIGFETCEQSHKVVTLGDVLNDQSENIKVLFEGIAGSGKTTMSLHICFEWAEKRLLKQFQLLIHVHFSDPGIRSAKNLSDLIPDTEEEVRDEVAAAIIHERGKGVCILLEGLDEAPDEVWDSLLFELIAAGTIGKSDLSGLSLILTTRPGCSHLKHLVNHMSMYTKLIIKGFDAKNVTQFIRNSLSNSASRALIQKVESNPRLMALCSLPLNAAIMTFLEHHFEKEIPETQTGITKLLLCNFLARHIMTRTGGGNLVIIENFGQDLEPYPDVREAFRKICSLSYSAVLTKKRYFTSDDLIKANLSTNQSDLLGILQIHVMSTVHGQEDFYCFLHFSVQEFLASVHLSLLDPHQQLLEVRHIYNTNPLNPVLPFYAGLTHLENEDVFKILFSAFDCSLDAATVFTYIQNNPSSISDPRRKALGFLNSLYESQNDQLITYYNVQLKPSPLFGNKLGFVGDSQMSFSDFNLTHADCLALGYFIRHVTLNMITPSSILVELGKCSEVGISSFLREAKKGINYKTCGRLKLNIYNYAPQDECSPLALREFLQGQSNILMFNMCIEPSLSKAMRCLILKCIIEGLSAMSSCHRIGLGFHSGSSQSYVYYLILLFFIVTRLCVHDINLYNPCSVLLITKALELSKVNVLILNNCSIDDVGLKILGNGISTNTILCTFDVKGNDCTTHGANQFLKCLISEVPVLSSLEFDDEIFEVLLSEEEYRETIQYIKILRLEHHKPPLVINKAYASPKFKEYLSKSEQLSNLPSKFHRRESSLSESIESKSDCNSVESFTDSLKKQSESNSSSIQRIHVGTTANTNIGVLTNSGKFSFQEESGWFQNSDEIQMGMRGEC